MKRIFLLAFLITSILSTQAQRITTAQASPTQTLKQNFGLGSVELNYSRPGLKNRKLGTDLAPYGKIWRTGANGATTIEFTDDVTIGGIAVKAGKYGILSIPDVAEWILIISKDLNVTEPDSYKQENDVVRVKAPVTKLGDKVETFTMNFTRFTASTCELQFTWENSSVSLPISTNTDEKVMKQINDIFNKDSKPYYSAAQYYYDNGKDIAKAKEWIDKASADAANAKSMNVYLLKAKIYQKAGDKVTAKATAEKLISIATEAKNEDYIKFAQDIIKAL